MVILFQGVNIIYQFFYFMKFILLQKYFSKTTKLEVY